MKLTAIAPVLNEAPWIGYSILAALPYMHQFVYALDSATSDGTRELLFHIKKHYAFEKLVIFNHPTFHPHEQEKYNAAFNSCIEKATGDAVFFLHPDMVVVNPEVISKQWPDALAWWTDVTSFAGDFSTVISKGRVTQWKNIHAKKFGLHYSGGYGSQNEDFYHSEITGRTYRHFGTEFAEYPFEVAKSGIEINHYCELKPYRRRLEKMKLCLKTQNPKFDERSIDEMAMNHPRVTLEKSTDLFGEFVFEKKETQVPEVIRKYEPEFSQFIKSEELVYG